MISPPKALPGTSPNEDPKRRLKKVHRLEVAVVPFLQRTEDSSLANLIRQEEQVIAKQSGYMVKVVERAGQKLSEILVRSDPFDGGDCGRGKCLP